MKIHKNIIVTLLTALITTFVMVGGYTYATIGESAMNALGDVCDTIDLDAEETPEIMAKWPYLCINAGYHNRMNDFFNDKLTDLIDLVIMYDKSQDPLNDSFSNDPDFLVPEKIATNDYLYDSCGGLEDFETSDCKKEIIREECVGNVSSYCVAMEAMYIYIDYAKALEIKHGNILLSDIYGAGTEYGVEEGKYLPIGLDVLSPIAQDMKVVIQDEIENSKRIMTATVSAYNEFRLAYPLHRRYEDIIEDLIKYKTKLKSIRNKIIFLPMKFIDVTSTTCP